MAEPIAAGEPSAPAPPTPRRPTIIRAGTTSSAANTNVKSAVENGDVPPPVPPPPRPTSLPAPPKIPDSRPSQTADTSTISLPPRPLPAHPPPKPPTPTSTPKSSTPTSSPARTGRPEITIISARPMSEVTGMSTVGGATSNSVVTPQRSVPSVPPPPVPSNRPKPDGPGRPPPPPTKAVSSPSTDELSRRESSSSINDVLNVGSGSGSASSSGRTSPATAVRSTPPPSRPPPVPSNRPSGPYVPPPLPSNRPSRSYVHPIGATAPPPRPSTTPSKSGSSVDTPPPVPPAPAAKPQVSGSSEVKQAVAKGTQSAAPSGAVTSVGPPLPVRPKSVQEQCKVPPPVPPLPASKPQNSSSSPVSSTPDTKATTPTPVSKPTSPPPPVSPKPSAVKDDISQIPNDQTDLAKIRQSLSPVSSSPSVSPPPKAATPVSPPPKAATPVSPSPKAVTPVSPTPKATTSVSPPPIATKPSTSPTPISQTKQSLSPPPVSQKPTGASRVTTATPPPIANKPGTVTTSGTSRPTTSPPPVATKPAVAAKPSVPSKPSTQPATATSVRSKTPPQQVSAMSSAGMFGVSLRPTVGPGLEQPSQSNQSPFASSGVQEKKPNPFATAMPISSQQKSQDAFSSSFQQQGSFSSQQQDPFSSPRQQQQKQQTLDPFSQDPFSSQMQPKDSFSSHAQKDPFSPKQTQPDPFASSQMQPDPFSPKQTQSDPFGSWPPPSANTQSSPFGASFDTKPVPLVPISSQTAPPPAVPSSRPRPKPTIIKPTEPRASAVPITAPPPPVPSARTNRTAPLAWQPTPQQRGSPKTASKNDSNNMGSFIKEIESLYTKPPSPQTVDQQSSNSTSAIATPVVKPPSAGSPAVKPLPPPSSGSSTARPTIIRPTTAKSKGGPPPRPSGGPKVSSGSTAASLLDMPIPDTDVHTDTLKKSSSTSALGRAQSMRTAPARPSDQPKKKAPAPPRPSPMTKGPPKPPRSAPGIPGSKNTTASQPRGAPNLPPRPEPGHPLYKYMVTEPHGIAVFPYSKQNYDELSFEKDDVIILLRKVDEDWLFGRNVDDEGMFPKKFIKIVRALPGESPGKVDGPCAVGVYDYYSNAPDDLTFNKDDFIKLLSRVGDDWYKGECNGEIGMFPKNYVEVLEDLPEEKEDIKPDTLSGPRCRARFDFEAEGENDLDFEEGDVIRLIEPVGQEWMKGELNGKTGIFPLEFVEIIEHLPETSKAMSMPRGFAAPAAEIVVTPPTPVSDDNVVSALYDFDGMNSTELSFKTGDRIKVTNQVNAEWLIGECNGQKGRFPSNFIESIPPNLPPEDTTVSSTQVDGGSHCIAKYDYEAASSDDLDFKEGDKIILLERISDDWYKGSCHGKEGMFPKAFVDVVEDLPKDISSKRSSTRQRGGSFEELMPKAEALHDFTGETSGELTFKAGDVIYLLEKVNDDWYSGELKGSVGQFPVGFVEIIIPLPGAGGL